MTFNVSAVYDPKTKLEKPEFPIPGIFVIKTGNYLFVIIERKKEEEHTKEFTGKVFMELWLDNELVSDSRRALTELQAVAYEESNYCVAIVENVTQQDIMYNDTVIKIYSDELKEHKYIAYYRVSI